MVLAYMREAVRKLTGKPGGPQDRSMTNRLMIAKATKREGASLDDWKAVIDAQLESVRNKPDAWRYLCLSTITKPANWARLADAPKAGPANTSSTGAFVPRGEYTTI